MTNPQGDVTYPFTLTKLSREWKFETILSNPEGGPIASDLHEYGGELWFDLYDDSGPPKSYLVHGTPGSWSFEEIPKGGYLDLDSAGNPGFSGSSGPFLNKVLFFTERTPEGWEETELEYSRLFSRTSFVYAANDEPFITFTLPDAPNSAWIEYFWRRDGEWERGIVDEPDCADGAISITTDPAGSPVLCYLAYTGEYTQLRVAWWNPQTSEWDFYEADNVSAWFFSLDFDAQEHLCIAYMDHYEAEPDVYYDRLIYTVYDGVSWDKEVVDERPYSHSYYGKTLAHDPLGNAAIAYCYRKGYESGYDRDTIAEWFDGSEWRTYVLDEEGMSDYSPSILIAVDGTAYVLFNNEDRKEVVLARYE
ncbi:MAG: hypothetical protein A2Y63_00785 [Candidatus Riflebacteria bacterium RBG_13_59_9]|nr:MAG: hypothetical protein A2Y63_00785 [Candidatus Riflebacteria bacterium RBG_13_59_9]